MCAACVVSFYVCRVESVLDYVKFVGCVVQLYSILFIHLDTVRWERSHWCGCLFPVITGCSQFFSHQNFKCPIHFDNVYGFFVFIRDALTCPLRPTCSLEECFWVPRVRSDELAAFWCVWCQFQLSFLRSRPLWMLTEHRGHMLLSCAPACNTLKLWFDLQLSFQACCSMLF